MPLEHGAEWDTGLSPGASLPEPLSLDVSLPAMLHSAPVGSQSPPAPSAPTLYLILMHGGRSSRAHVFESSFV